MKRKTVPIAAIILLLVCGAGIISAYAIPKIKTEKTNKAIAEWMDDNLEKAECLTYNVGFKTNVEPPAAAPGEITDDTRSLIIAEFTFCVMKPEQRAKVYFNKGVYSDGKNDYLEEYEDRFFYIAIEGDELAFYFLKEGGGYARESIRDAELCRLTDQTLFFNDANVFYSEKYLTGNIRDGSGNYPEYRITRYIETKAFYEGLVALAESKPSDMPELSLALKLIGGNITPSDGIRLELNFTSGIKELTEFVYKAVTQTEYENVYKLNKIAYTQSLTVSFPSEFDEEVYFELPKDQ